MDALMVHPEEMMITWDSGFGNQQLGVSEDVLGTDGTISRTEAQVLYRPQRVNRRDGTEIKGEHVYRGGQSPGRSAHQELPRLRQVRQGTELPVEIGFRVAIATRMAVDSYRLGRVLKWIRSKR